MTVNVISHGVKVSRLTSLIRVSMSAGGSETPPRSRVLFYIHGGDSVTVNTSGWYPEGMSSTLICHPTKGPLKNGGFLST
jgi:hypothetical protein